LAIFIAGIANDADPGEPLSAVSDPSGVTIVQGDAPVLHYQRAVKSMDGKWPRANYVHPLFDLEGRVISEDFPSDHGHHRGVFWAWHQVWVGDKKLGDPWVCKDFLWEIESLRTTRRGESLSVQATVMWKSPDHLDATGQLAPVVRETTKITVYPELQNYRVIDFAVSLLALVDDVKIGGSEDVKGYGGFSPRIKLNAEQRFESADGIVEPVKTSIKADRWINIADNTNGIAIIARATNPQPNDRWILRRSNSMQNAVYPGRQPVALSNVQPTVLQYRLVIHRGDLPPAQIQKLQTDFDRP
jgi:hypothetical protein